MNKEKQHHDARIRNLQQPYMPSDKEIEEINERNAKRERIYHYTSMDTFYKLLDGIKEDCFTFHAGSVYTMNDSQEMVLGYNKIKKYLPIVENKLKIPKEERLLNLTDNKEKNRDISDQFGEWMINDDTTNFVISFSATPDILPMWILYGGNSAGVCMEFSPYVIKQYYKQKLNENHLEIEKCVYTEKDVENFLLKDLEVIYKLFLKQNDKSKRSDPNIKTQYLATMCGVIGAFVKHPGFEYEKEIRMNLFRHKKKWIFAETNHHHHTVYVESVIPTSALTGIMVGPATNMKDVKNSMILALRSKGIIVEPKHSEIPYRIY